MRTKGTVRWFDPVKGYGFVVVDGMDDVLLHRSVVAEANLPAIYEGAVLDVEIAEQGRSKQVRRIHAVIDPGLGYPPREAPPTRRPREILLEDPTAPEREAECKWFSRPKGYGFLITTSDPEEVFVHMDLLRKHGLRELRMGQRVRIRTGRGPKGLTATEIHPAEAPCREGPYEIPPVARHGRAEKRTRPATGEILHGVVARLATVNEAEGFGILSLPELDDVAYAPLALLRAAGALDPKTCFRLICDVEYVRPLLVVRCLTRVH